MADIPIGYKQTEIGIIPNDWEIKKISDFTDVVTGGTPNTSVKEFWGGNIKWMASGEVNKKFIYDVEGRITQHGYENSSTHMLPEGSVLIGLAGQGKTRGTAAYNYIPLCTNQSIGAILPNNKFISLYLYYYIDSKYEDLRSLSSGDGGRGGLNKKILLDINAVLPPTVEEQQAIATTLSDMDELISNLDELIEKKKNIKKGAMQKLLSPKDGWIETTLGEIAKINTGSRNGNEEVENGKYPFFVRSATVFRINSYSFDGEAILVPGEGGIGDIFHYINGKFDYHQRVYKISTFSNNVFGKYLYYYMKKYFKEQAMTFTSKATVNSLRLEAFLTFKVYLPTIEEQQAIASILSDMDKEIEALEQKKAKYENIKQGDMQKLLTGQIRLV